MIRAFAGLLVLALLALPLRTILAHPLTLSVLPSLQVDAAAYDAIAADVVRTRSLEPIPLLQPPGFVLTMALVYALAGHSWVAAKVALWLAFVVCVALAARLAWRIYGHERHAWAAALLTASAPALHGYVTTIQYEAVAGAWLLVLVLSADRAREGRVGMCALVGLAAAAATLTREVFVVTVPVVAMFVAHQSYRAGAAKRAITGALIVASCALAPVWLWATLQTGRAGRVVAISDKGPLVMAFGNNPHANGTFNAPLVGVGEPSGLAFIRAEPARFTALAGRKFLYFWGILRDGWNVPRPSAIWVARSVGGIVPMEWVLPLARGGWALAVLVIALAMWRRAAWQQWWVVPAAIAAMLSVHLVTVSSHRFAVPILPVVFAIAAAPLVSAAEWLAASRRRRLACAVSMAVVLAMQYVEWPVRYSVAAVDTDGLSAVNAVGQDGRAVRVAAGGRGRRAVMLLADEALPAGTFEVIISTKAAASAADQTIAQAWIQTDAGARMCELAIQAPQTPGGEWFDAAMPCRFDADTVATIVIETTGLTDVSFGSLRMRW